MEKIVVFLLILIIIVALSKSFSQGRLLQTAPEVAPNPADIFTLILYGGTESNDLETLAILDRENDRYMLEPYAPNFKYKIKKNLPAKEAFGEAERFVHWHHAFQRSQINTIVDDGGAVIGYEVRPLYSPITFGIEDLLDVEYRLKNGKVAVIVRLKPSIDMTRL